MQREEIRHPPRASKKEPPESSQSADHNVEISASSRKTELAPIKWYGDVDPLNSGKACRRKIKLPAHLEERPEKIREKETAA